MVTSYPDATAWRQYMRLRLRRPQSEFHFTPLKTPRHHTTLDLSGRGPRNLFHDLIFSRHLKSASFSCNVPEARLPSAVPSARRPRYFFSHVGNAACERHCLGHARMHHQNFVNLSGAQLFSPPRLISSLIRAVNAGSHRRLYHALVRRTDTSHW